jgi:hypothetical protein
MSNPQRIRRYDLIIAGGVFLLISLYFTYASFTSFLNQANAANSYHSVTAVVTHTQLSSQKNGIYTPNIQYQYFY